MDAFDVMMVALKFNEKINARDLEGLVELMTEDHIFIDIPGEVSKGRDVMKAGWHDFFTTYPDYRNIFTRVQVDNDFVVMVGYSSCSYDPLDGPSLVIVGARLYLQIASAFIGDASSESPAFLPIL